MGEIADEFLVGQALVEQALFAVQFQLLDVLAQFDDDLGLAGRADDAVHVQRVARRTEQRQVLAQVGIFVRDRLFAQGAQFVAVGEQADQLLARQRLGRHVEQMLGGRVGVANEPIGIRHQHGGGEHVEACETVVLEKLGRCPVHVI